MPVPNVADLSKRILLGRAMPSHRLGDTLLPKRIGVPVFASDALSSVAYAPDQIFLTLSIAGLSAYAFSWEIGLAVAVVLLVVIASYRQTVHAYPSGGGDYEVAAANLGERAGLVGASTLLVDYVLSVAVATSSAAQYAASTLEALRGDEVFVACVLVLILMAINLRGTRDAGLALAIPSYAFMVAILGMTLWGFVRHLSGTLPPAESARFELVPEAAYAQGLTGLAGAFVLIRAFSSGCAALAGVESVSNGVPAFRRPKSRNAATALLILGLVSVAMLLGLVALANVAGLRYAQDPARQLLLHGRPVGEGYAQNPVIGQLATAVFDQVPIAATAVTAVTTAILILAANTAFNGFPILGSILAQDRYLPRQLHTRGDRLAFSNGIILLAGFSLVLIIGFRADVNRLIPLYLVSVFVAFTISQAGMAVHWTRLLRSEEDPSARGRMHRSRAVNVVGLLVTGLVLVVVVVTKVLLGAWIAIAAMVALYFLMRGIHRHYDSIARELQVLEGERETLPSRNHAIVLVSKIHKPTLRALNYARASRPTTVEAVTVDVDPAETVALQVEWDRRDIPVPLKVLDSPYREITRPVVDYVKNLRRESPRDVVTVYIPEYVVGRWWEALLHNQSALRLKTRLLFTPGVMVTSVPWQLRSSRRAAGRPDSADTAVRRSDPVDPLRLGARE